MYRQWGFGVILGVLAVLACYGMSQGANPATKECTFSWEPSPTLGLEAYRLYGAGAQGGQQVGQNYIHIPLTVLADPTHPKYSVMCQELSWWKVTAYSAVFAVKESVFSNEVQVPVFTIAPPRTLIVTSIEDIQQGLATMTQTTVITPKKN